MVSKYHTPKGPNCVMNSVLSPDHTISVNTFCHWLLLLMAPEVTSSH